MVGKERKWSKKYQTNLQQRNGLYGRDDLRHMPSFDEKAHHQIQGPGDSHRDLRVAPLLGRWNVAGAVAELCVCVFVLFSLFFGWGSERPGFVSIRVMRFKICPR